MNKQYKQDPIENANQIKEAFLSGSSQSVSKNPKSLKFFNIGEEEKA